MTPKRDALERLAEACARRAGSVLASLLERKLDPDRVGLEVIAAGDLARHLPDGQDLAAVLAELEGSSVGRIALIVSSGAAREAISSLVEARGRKRRTGLATDLLAASALLEMGNIAFSAAANALAESIGGRVFPSVPRFSSDPAADLAQAWPREANALIAQLELLGASGALPLYLVWLPDESSWPSD
jgi:chemotaxis protein CheY-P-specific phosphatase CheC